MSRTEEVYAFLKERGGWVARSEVDRFVREKREGRSMMPTASPDRGAGHALNGLLRGGSVRYMEDQGTEFWAVKEEAAATRTSRYEVTARFTVWATSSEEAGEKLADLGSRSRGIKRPGPDRIDRVVRLGPA